MPDATFFSIDVAVAKARNVAYYANPAQLQPIDKVAGLPAGTAITNRTFRYLSEPRFPEGSTATRRVRSRSSTTAGRPRSPGANVGPPLPASAFQSVQGYDAFNPDTNFHDPTNPANQNGIVFFPAARRVYKTSTGRRRRSSAAWASAATASTRTTTSPLRLARLPAGEHPPRRPSQVRGVRLPYQKFNRNPSL